MEKKCDLPAEQKSQRERQKAPCVPVQDKEERCKHHGIIPVVDPAGTAALVFQKPGLERTEKQNTDHVTDGICTAQKEHETFVYNVRHIQSAEDHIETDPYKKNKNSGIIILYCNVDITGLLVIARELPLAAGAFQPVRDKAQDHFHGENDPHDPQKDRIVFQSTQDQLVALHLADDIESQHDQKKGAPVYKTDIMVDADRSQLYFLLLRLHMKTSLPLRSIYGKRHFFDNSLNNRTRSCKDEERIEPVCRICQKEPGKHAGEA